MRRVRLVVSNENEEKKSMEALREVLREVGYEKELVEKWELEVTREDDWGEISLGC
jgi:hypothetical protein